MDTRVHPAVVALALVLVAIAIATVWYKTGDPVVEGTSGSYDLSPETMMAQQLANNPADQPEVAEDVSANGR